MQGNYPGPLGGGARMLRMVAYNIVLPGARIAARVCGSSGEGGSPTDDCEEAVGLVLNGESVVDEPRRQH
jgi:hypothetical protein